MMSERTGKTGSIRTRSVVRRASWTRMIRATGEQWGRDILTMNTKRRRRMIIAPHRPLTSNRTFHLLTRRQALQRMKS